MFESPSLNREITAGMINSFPTAEGLAKNGPSAGGQTGASLLDDTGVGRCFLRTRMVGSVPDAWKPAPKGLANQGIGNSLSVALSRRLPEALSFARYPTSSPDSL